MSVQSPVKVLHVAVWARTVGGVETLLGRHALHDAQLGLDARQLSFFDEPATAPSPDFSALGFSGRSTTRSMRRAFGQACATHAGSVVIYHGAWAVPWFADVDRSLRRILFLHASFVRYAGMLPHLAGLADGIVCATASTAEEVGRRLPGMTPDRIRALAQPIAPPPEIQPRQAGANRWVVGFAGRLVRAEKCAHRLVPFVRAARRLGLDFRLEVMGDGPERSALEQQLGNDPDVHFLGWQRPADSWRHYQTWDAIVSFSDREGGPFTLIEAMAVGAIPIYPRIGGSLGDDYAPRVDPVCYYTKDDPAAAAHSLQSLQAKPPGELAQLRRRGQALVQPHIDGNYDAGVADFVCRIATLPRISRMPDGRRQTRMTDFLPLGVVTRVCPDAMLR